ncbi:hypothetical protein SMG44B_30469 [Stenotrophomonas maltophilia]|nr:hypothetical protein BN1263100009 [Stenotrophomonas maltophilia]
MMPGTGNLTLMPIHPSSTALRHRLLHANKHGYPGGNQENVHHHDAPQHPPFPLMERLPFGSKGKHCNTAQAPKPPINLDDSDCSEYFRPFTLDFQQHSVSRKCIYPHGT